MTVIDPTSPVGKVRLMISDWADIPILPDSVIQSALADNSDNIPQSAKQCALYILGILSMKTDRQMGLQLIVKGSQAFTAYKQFLMLITTNPAFMSYSPMPYSATSGEISPILQFQQAWVQNFPRGTEGQQLNLNALYSPNEGGEYGKFPIYSSEGY